MIKGAKTIEQYKLIKYIQEQFIWETIRCELINRNTVKVVDSNGDSISFSYLDDKISSS